MTQQRIKSSILLLFILGYISVYGQSEFSIKGYGQKLKDGDSLFLSYRESGKFVLKSTTVTNKEFNFTGLIKLPTKAYISRNGNPNYVDVIPESVYVFLEPGNIVISSPDTLTNAIVSGTLSNEILQLFENQQSKLRERRRAIKDPDFFAEMEKRDSLLVIRNKKEIEKMFYEEADDKLTFAKKHPNSYVSLDMLYDLSRINTYMFKVEEVYISLSDRLKETEQGVTISERIKKKKQLIPGMKAIDFSMKDINGKTINLSHFNGKYVLLDFWASWCGPCREEHPNLINVYEKYKDEGFTIISISIDTDKEKWVKAIAKDKLTWTQVSDLNGNKGEVYMKYGITSIPANFLIDHNGIIVSKDLKGESLVNELLKEFSNKR